MRTVIIIQARINSSSLPGKVMMDLAGQPLLAHVVRRCQRSKLSDAVVVATSTEPSDEPISLLCGKIGVQCFRGPLDDVLARYVGAARMSLADVVVRVTADCPLIDPDIIDACIAAFGEKPLDYVSNVNPLRTFPRGLDVEVFSLRALLKAQAEATTPYEREHVTPYLWENKRGEFAIGAAVLAPDAYRKPYRLAVDYPEDFALIEELYTRCAQGDALVSTAHVIACLDAHPTLAAKNAHRESPPPSEKAAGKMVVIVDYDMGNVGSVKNALDFLGVSSILSREPQDLQAASHIILPGVGAFKDGMDNLRRFGLLPVLQKEVLEKKKPFLGVCLGMQLLAEAGEEGGHHEGLSFVKGTVRKFRTDPKKFRIPHIGWNDVVPQKDSVLFRGIASDVFYFVHSYFLEPSEEGIVEATCSYGETFPAAIRKGSIFGVQFHPEKSQKSGLALLKNFIDYA